MFVGSLLNNGFINRNEPDIKGIICGKELYIKVLRKNFSLGDIYTGEAQEKIALEFDMDITKPTIPGVGGSLFDGSLALYWFYFDINGLGYYKIEIEDSNAFVTYVSPQPHKHYIGDYFYGETSFRRRGNLIIMNNNYYERSHLDEPWVLDSSDESTWDLSKLTISYEVDDEKVVYNCLFFPLPGIIEVKN